MKKSPQKTKKNKKSQPVEEECSLWAKKLLFIPEYVFGLENLTVLNLSYNNFTTIPEQISNLNHLQSITATNNRLSFLPENFKKLKKLKILDLSYNQFTKIPSEISNLKNLNYIDFSGNSIQTFSNEFQNLQKLRFLSFRCNQLTKIPNEIIKNEKLIKFAIENNPLQSFPYQIGYLFHLRYFTFNEIKGKEIEHFVSIEEYLEHFRFKFSSEHFVFSLENNLHFVDLFVIF